MFFEEMNKEKDFFLNFAVWNAESIFLRSDVPL